MNAREYLENIRTMDKEISSRLIMIEELESAVTSASVKYSDMPRPATHDNTSREKMLVKLVDLKHEINAEIDDFVDYKREAIELIRKLSNPEYRIIIINRYFKYKTWVEIENSTGTCMRRSQQLHNKAIKELDSLLEIFDEKNSL